MRSRTFTLRPAAIALICLCTLTPVQAGAQSGTDAAQRELLERLIEQGAGATTPAPAATPNPSGTATTPASPGVDAAQLKALQGLLAEGAKSGAIPTVPTTPSPSSAPVVTTPAAPTTTPSPAAPDPAPSVGAATTPGPPAPAQVPGELDAKAVARAAQADRGAGSLPAGLLAAAIIAGMLVLLALALTLFRWLALEPRWWQRWRHATDEATFRLSCAWADFGDWVRLGR